MAKPKPKVGKRPTLVEKEPTLEEYVERSKPPPPGGQETLVIPDRGDGWRVFGVVSDTHLGSKHERLDVLNSLYDIFAQEGITQVLHGGNWVEGESRFNKHDIKIYGMDAQLNYFIDNYPARNGMRTFYVSGDDHEGWWQQREVINIGQTLEDKAIRVGRHDLKFLAYSEADIELTAKKGSAVLRLMHGGGGAAYAYSYVLQKQVESFQGGEKPAILIMGHHHKFDYCYPRSVHAIMPGCTQDQSIFMRKRKIEAHVGGVICWLQQADDGTPTRFRAEWIPFYDRGFYERRYGCP
jgi:predicted phosphodiesterase